MRTILLVLFICLLQANVVKGQEFAFSSTAFVKYEYPDPVVKHHNGEGAATKVGKILLISGGAALVVGTGLLIIGENESRGVTSPADQSGLFPTVSGILLWIGGAGCVLAGTGVFVGGKIHDAHNRRRYSITGSKNQLGIAYNF
jgi:hypothetical protein